ASISGVCSKFAFHSNPDGDYELYVKNADGANQTRLTNTMADNLYPSFSRDGSKIAFDSYNNLYGHYAIYVMNADGSNQTRLTNLAEDYYLPSFSADGSKIAVYSWLGWDGYPGGGYPQIYVMNANGSNQTRLTNMTKDYSPSFSADGSKIAFYSIRDGNGESYVMDAGGCNQT